MITPLQKTALKRRAHDLKPVVLLGQHGLSDAVLNAIDEALSIHELVKIKLAGVEREQVEAVQQGICEPLHAEAICQIGHMLVIYRKKPPAKQKTAAKPKAKAKGKAKSKKLGLNRRKV